MTKLIRIGLILLLSVFLVPIIYAATNESLYDESVAPVMNEGNNFIASLIKGVVQIAAGICFLSGLYGFFFNKQTYFRNGALGFIVIIGLAILYGVLITGFEYVTTKYW